MGEKEEERQVAVRPDEGNGLVGEAIRQVLALLAPGEIEVRHVGIPLLAGVPVRKEVARRTAVGVAGHVDIESVRPRPVGRPSQVPFPDAGRDVSRLAHRLRQSGEFMPKVHVVFRRHNGGVFRIPVPSDCRDVPGEADTPRIPAGHQRGTAGRADGAVRVGPCEPGALGCKAVDPRGFVIVRALAAQVHPAEIVDQHEHDAERLRRRLLDARACGQDTRGDYDRQASAEGQPLVAMPWHVTQYLVFGKPFPDRRARRHSLAAATASGPCRSRRTVPFLSSRVGCQAPGPCCPLNTEES